ncbi:alpha-amylase family glycosyl hydrolase [Caviibacter abscessus]|uniref:alpha-amylase family glycosyl hydrolase n=1 Tax=Caviibacter abscessus TaxID=1766719 RepID=UPI0008313620|nr:alpha-amylase family glycosyl hydrolase [Caviibacter abscessus]
MKKILCFLFLLIISISCSHKEGKYYENTNEDIINKSGIYYEIFVRSYADSNGDGIGDLNGIISKLDELKELGVNGIWLTPIFTSPSYHKYDVTDYYNIDKEYGTIEDFKNLVKVAHQKGIKVIIDLPVNHTSREHNWFKNARSSKNSEYRNYYRIENKNNKEINFKVKPLGSKAWTKLNENELYYSIFWEGMPDLNFSNKKVRDEIKKIAKYWVEIANIDGYRLDAAFHIYGQGEYEKKINTQEENIKWWNEFRNSLREIKKDIYLVSEVWQSYNQIAKYYKVFDSSFNFTFSEKGIIKAIISKNGDELAYNLEKIYKKYSEITKNYIDALFLTNHDQNRIASILKNTEQQKLAAAILLTLPGNPFIYYGEELGMKGIKPDESIREPYLWGDNFQTKWEDIVFNAETDNIKKQKQDKNSIYNHYKKWINIRNKSDVIKYGTFKHINMEDKEIFAYEREYENKKIKIYHNLSNEQKEIKIDNSSLKIKGYESAIIY